MARRGDQEKIKIYRCGMNKKFIQFLRQKNLLSNEDINKIVEIKNTYNANIGDIILNLGVINENELLNLLSEFFNLPILSDENNIEKIDNINIEFFFQKGFYPFKLEKENLYLAVGYNYKFNELIKIKNMFKNFNFKIYFANQEIINYIKSLYEKDIEEISDISNIDEIEKLKELASEAPVIKMINKHFSNAIKFRSSDIHYESFKKGMKVRFRIDGVLRTVEMIPKKYKNAVIARLKLLSKMNIAENRLPQDGRISIKYNKQEIDIRASSVPTAFGESFVLRLLGKQNINYSLNALEFYEDQLSILRKIVKKPHGIFLTTGPTGSGKTTTLYSLLNELNTDDVKIITVEDPVEYELEGINQIQVKSDIGFDFSNALRSILRQDPDIIMIGEIRDIETAKIAVQSSLTGHFVLSTLHTNSALGAITRLLDMGVEYFLLKASIKGLMAQRLVRKLCPYCKQKIDLDKDLARYLNVDELLKKFDFINLNTYKAVGCEKCAYTGYIGRLPVAEIVEFDDNLQDILEKQHNFNDLSVLGVRSLKEDAILKFLEGKTSYEEIIKVVG
jgi:general secretion pathway protein E